MISAACRASPLIVYVFLYLIRADLTPFQVQLDYVVHKRYCICMKTLPVAKVRANFSALLKEVESGSEVGIAFGRKQETIAVIVPIEEYKKIKARKLGTLEGKVKVEFSENWAMSDEELINI